MEQMANKIHSLVVRFASGKKAIELFLSMVMRENDSDILKFQVMFFGKLKLFETELVKREESLGFDLMFENGCYCSKKGEGIIGIVRFVGFISWDRLRNVFNWVFTLFWVVFEDKTGLGSSLWLWISLKILLIVITTRGGRLEFLEPSFEKFGDHFPESVVDDYIDVGIWEHFVGIGLEL